jgi:hypothetical protein
MSMEEELQVEVTTSVAAPSHLVTPSVPASPKDVGVRVTMYFVW